MSITTRTGDDGTTYSAALRRRVPKDHPIIEFEGVLDRAISSLGLARAFLPAGEARVDSDLRLIQNILFALGASLSRGEGAPEEAVRILEEMVEKYYGEPLKHFVIPSGGPAASAVHLARALVRDAERRLVSLSRQGEVKVDPSLVKVINRASDALFAIAVYLARRYGGGLEKAYLTWDFLSARDS